MSAMATGWRILEDERTLLFTPAAFHLTDAFTAGAPVGEVRLRLEARTPAGTWEETDVEPVVTASSVVIFPGLGLTAEPWAAPPRRYRLVIESRSYRPDYRRASDGIEFDAPPFNHTNPPAALPLLTEVELHPSTAYPYPHHVPLLDVLVTDRTTGSFVPDVVVESVVVVRSRTKRESALTDDRGWCRLPLRWMPAGQPITIRATDERTNRTQSRVVTLPQALGQPLVFAV